MSSVKGVPASAMSVVIVVTSSPCLRMMATSAGKSSRDRGRFDMPALAYRQVQRVEPEIGYGFGEILTLQELEVFGEDRNFSFGRAAAGPASSRVPPAKHRASRKQVSYRSSDAAQAK